MTRIIGVAVGLRVPVLGSILALIGTFAGGAMGKLCDRPRPV